MNFKSVLLKISGEALANTNSIIAIKTLELIINTIKMITTQKIQLALVIGGGNISRGNSLVKKLDIDKVNADHMSMLATVINGIAINDYCHKHKIDSVLYSAFNVGEFVKGYNRQSAIQNLHRNQVVIFSGGIGSPFFSTDSCAALRGIELKVDLIIKATNIDGVYDQDPKLFTDAKKYSTLNVNQAIQNQIAVMDQTAFVLCQENKLPIFVYNINAPSVLINFLNDTNDNAGSFITV